MKYLQSHSRLVSRIQLLFVVLTLSGLLAACSGPLRFLTGGGPNVAANVPVAVGQDVDQGLVNVEAPSITVRPKARTGNITQDTSQVKADEVQTIVVNEVPVWVVLLLVLGWLLPSPGEIGRWVRDLFRRK